MTPMSPVMVTGTVAQPVPVASRARPGTDAVTLAVAPGAWRQAFDRLDHDRDGALSFPECAELIDRIAPSCPR